MRTARFSIFVFSSGLILGACSSDDDDHDHECSDAQLMRADTILDTTADSSAGAMVFAQSCGVSSCHGADGNAGPAPDLADEIPDHHDDELACLLLAGDGGMPSQASLTDQQLADVLAYVMATF